MRFAVCLFFFPFLRSLFRLFFFFFFFSRPFRHVGVPAALPVNMGGTDVMFRKHQLFLRLLGLRLLQQPTPQATAGRRLQPRAYRTSPTGAVRVDSRVVVPLPALRAEGSQ